MFLGLSNSSAPRKHEMNTAVNPVAYRGLDILGRISMHPVLDVGGPEMFAG